jgi:hypothetical protein
VVESQADLDGIQRVGRVVLPTMQQNAAVQMGAMLHG